MMNWNDVIAIDPDIRGGKPWFPRSSVDSRHGPLERPDGIPTLERGNERNERNQRKNHSVDRRRIDRHSP